MIADVEKNTQNKQVIPISVISFLVGIVISSGTMFTFMESRIEKRVLQTEKVARLEERLQALKDVTWESNNSQSSKFNTLSNRILVLEAKSNKYHASNEGK